AIVDPCCCSGRGLSIFCPANLLVDTRRDRVSLPTNELISEMLMGVQRLGQVIYVAADMEPSVAFYRDVLGLRLKFQEGGRWAAFDTGQATFALSSPQEATGCPGSM